MRDHIQKIIADICKSRFQVDVWPELDRPDEKFGDFTTNVAMHIAKTVKSSPKEIADVISQEFMTRQQSSTTDNPVAISAVRAESQAPGFVNFTLNDTALVALTGPEVKPNKLANQEIVIEFGDPNPFKEMHLGHLYSTIIGDNVARLVQTDGAHVHRVSYHGDVGMHVAKAVYAIGEEIHWDTNQLNSLNPDDAANRPNSLPTNDKIGYLYAKGAKAFSEDRQAADKIRNINKQIYAETDPVINTIYNWGLKTSFAGFDRVFDLLGVQYQKRYLESQAAPIGQNIVKKYVGTVFEESQGAVVFKEDNDKDLHTRVFISSEGLPTYEAKELGLAELKAQDYPKATQSIIITAQEQNTYFQVVLAALNKVRPDLASKTRHLSHGFLSLSSGKMSSRTGNVHSAQTLLNEVFKAVQKAFPDSEFSSDIFMAAIKYTFLKNRIGKDMVFDISNSVTLEGNSGPYLQYSYARAHGIKRKIAENNDVEAITELNIDERSLVRKMGEYSETVSLAINTLMPHHICNYLYELAQNFNHFYENNPVVGDARQNVRLQLIDIYVDTIRSGLELLGIPTPEKL